jgi:hypothetical protein
MADNLSAASGNGGAQIASLLLRTCVVNELVAG